ncbi:DNA polymerase III subunit chi [Croceicoccus ponticola]|uniref:DNA polymerase III subunit chi n=1 Tax=Croceicoccus ponticola TaxID=2217664 RepID=A0A437GWZ6_9SPHN|nr:DNA polymerase III subunit chi [Croceicoccus ponticola]RVQ66900.1 DNA polymerase III subunit chi [Croceicoccus ponticola]
MRVDFYHLSRDPAPMALAQIAAKALEQGQRLFVVSDDDAQRAALSDALWSAAGFLANGEVGDRGAELQPVLIAPKVGPAANGAKVVALADGRWRDDALAFDRTMLFFDAATIDGARAAWRTLGERDDVERHYWKLVDGRWVVGP